MRKAPLPAKILILVLVLAVPGFLYYLLVELGKNHYKPLSVFGPKTLAQTTHKDHGKMVPDTIYHHLPDFTLTDQDGRRVTLHDFDNKIFVACFFYTGCPDICRQMNENMSQLAADYAKNPMVYFLSITVDPKHDSVPVLKKYAQGFKSASKKWLFLTGDTSTIYNLARKGFLVNALQSGRNNFVYEDKLMLVDEDKRIRGYYNGSSADEEQRLDDEIKVLLSEELLKKDSPMY